MNDAELAELDEKRDRIASVLQDGTLGEMPQGSLVTAWVVVIEWVDPNGESWLEGISSPGLTEWKRNGMLDDKQGDWSSEQD